MSSPPVRNLDTDTCCPEEAELIPCSACYEKHHREAAANALLLSSLSSPPPPVEPMAELKASSASLQRVPPPEIPHGHAASAPEDITHHEAHARQLPVPSPPDPGAASAEGSGRVQAQQAAAASTGGGGGEREATTQEMTRREAAAMSPPPSSAAPSRAPAVAHPQQTAMSSPSAQHEAALTQDAAQQQQQQQPQQHYFNAPLPYYGQLGLTQQQAEMYSSMYLQQPQQQQQPAAHMQSAFLPQLLPQQAASLYGGGPVTMQAANGTLVYYPHSASAMSDPASAAPLSHGAQQQQAQHQHQQQQMPPPGLINYYQPQHQPRLPPQQQQPQHLAPAQAGFLSHQPAHAPLSMQQPVAFMNGIPMYLSPAPLTADSAQQQQQPRAAPAPEHLLSMYQAASPTASTLSASSSGSSDAFRSFSVSGEADKACLTYKTEICRSHQYSGACEYGSSCQFAHGLEELRTREVDSKFKTERCKNFHAFGPSTCWYGPRCKFIHDEYRVRVGQLEFWLISPRENMVRVEKVDPGNAPRIAQLQQLVQEQTGAAQQAAQQLMQQMQQLVQLEAACEQMKGLGLQTADGRPLCSSSSSAGCDPAACFLRAILSPCNSGVSGSMAAPINVQAMQVKTGASHHGGLQQHSAAKQQHSLLNPVLLGNVAPQLPSAHYARSALPLPQPLPHPQQQQQPLSLPSFLPHGLPHQQSGGLYSTSNADNGAAAAAAFHLPNCPPQHSSRRPPPPPAYAGQQPLNSSAEFSHSQYSSSSPLSMLGSLISPRALQSLLALNAGGGVLSLLGSGSGDEPRRRKRSRKKKAKSRAFPSAADGSNSSSEQPDEQRDDNTEQEAEQQPQQQRAAAAAAGGAAAAAANSGDEDDGDTEEQPDSTGARSRQQTEPGQA